jgi:hypothetical protein
MGFLLPTLKAIITNNLEYLRFASLTELTNELNRFAIISVIMISYRHTISLTDSAYSTHRRRCVRLA